MQEFWLARVFWAAQISGSLTAVLFGETAMEPAHNQAVAARLSLSDTAFIYSDAAGRLTHRTFSPHEELTFCVQALLASAAVCARRRGEASGSFAFETKAGTATVTGREGEGWWLSASPDRAQEVEEAPALLAHLGLRVNDLAAPLCTAGIGRRRLYIPLSSAEGLYQFRIAATTVMKVATAYGLTGICPFVVVTPERVLLRVFTTSLVGGEDVATGGAALGLLGYELRHSLGLADIVRVEQGHIESVQRGCLFVRKEGREQAAGLGGQVDLLAHGDLQLAPGPVLRF